MMWKIVKAPKLMWHNKLVCEKRREICSFFGFKVYLVGEKLDLFLNQI